MDLKPNPIVENMTNMKPSDLKEYLKGIPQIKPKTRMITIDMHCKRHALIFANDAQQINKPKPIRAKSSRIKAATELHIKNSSSVPPPESTLVTRNRTQSTSGKGGIKLTRISKKKSAEVLGSLNVGSGSPQTPSKQLTENNNNTFKRRLSTKRKRFVGDDNDIAAENIPVEAVFPALRHGVNRDICPMKRRRLHSLISPDTPPSPPTPEVPTRSFRIARKY